MPAGWTVIIPAKRLTMAKSRLQAPGVDRSALALAMLRDTLTAVAEAEQVSRYVLLTADAGLQAIAQSCGAQIRTEPAPGELNRSLRTALIDHPTPGPVAVVAGDLPAMKGEDLDSTLLQAESLSAAYVPDWTGTGTTILAGRDTGSLLKLGPRFGPDSAFAHARAGASPVTTAPPARRDVDTWADLLHAAVLGLGAFTAEVLSPFQELSTVAASSTSNARLQPEGAGLMTGIEA